MNVCETFGVSPSEAWREIYERNPAGWVSSLLDLRSYRRAWSDMKRDPEMKHTNESPWHARVLEIEGDLAMAKLAQRNTRKRVPGREDTSE